MDSPDRHGRTDQHRRQQHWTNRNSFIGLSGNFGTTLVGRHDTPLKLVGRKADLFGDQIGDSRNLITTGSLGDNAS